MAKTVSRFWLRNLSPRAASNVLPDLLDHVDLPGLQDLTESQVILVAEDLKEIPEFVEKPAVRESRVSQASLDVKDPRDKLESLEHNTAKDQLAIQEPLESADLRESLGTTVKMAKKERLEGPDILDWLESLEPEEQTGILAHLETMEAMAMMLDTVPALPEPRSSNKLSGNRIL